MSLVERSGLFNFLTCMSEKERANAIREFIIQDEKQNYCFLNLVYDKEDYLKYR